MKFKFKCKNIFFAYILEFLLFSFLGWVIDSLDRSFHEKRWVNAGYFESPICPIYGLGGLALMFIFKYFAALPIPLLLVAAASGMVLLEYTGGVFSERVLRVKLWDYSSSRFNIGGYIDLAHSFYWLILAAGCYCVVFPFVSALEGFVVAPDYLGMPAALLAALVLVYAAFRRNPARFLNIGDKFLNLTIDEYHKVLSDIAEMNRTVDEDGRNKMKEAINRYLKKANARLRG